MADYQEHPREHGPPIVVDGPAGAPAIIVFDPAGAAKHDDIPASWHPLRRERRVIWCRMPAKNALGEADNTMAELAAHDVTVDAVTSGPVAEVAMMFTRRWASAVRSLLLVDPAAPDQRFATDEAELADALWEKRSQRRMHELVEAGVAVRVVAHSAGGDRDRVPPPLPLGHPDLVEVIRGAIEELDAAGGGEQS